MSEALPTGKLLLAENNTLAEGGTVPAAVATLTRQSAVAMTGGILSQGLKFLVVIYIARRLSISEFGLISFAIAVNAFMFIVSNFGLPVFGSRAVARSGIVSRGLLGEIACLRAFLALGGMIVSVGILCFVPGISRVELLLVGIFGLSNVAQAGLFDWAFQGLHRQEASAILNIIWQGGWLAMTVLGMHLGMGILSVPAALSGAALLASGVGYLWLLQTGQIRCENDDHVNILRRSWEILKLATPLGWGTLLMTVLIWSDAIVVRLLRGEQAVGLYAAGNRAALALAMLSSFYMQGAFPLLSRASEEGPSHLNQYFQRCYDDMAMVFLPGSVWAIFYAREVILLVFKNPEYLSAASVFRIFQVMFLLAALSNLFGIGAAVATHRDRDYQRVLVLTTFVFLPLCVVLTAWRGNLGASAAALLAQGLSLILFAKKTQGVVHPNHAAALLVPLLVGVGVGAVSKFVGLSLYWSAGLLILAYAGMFGTRFRTTFPREGII
jgi:O-antigen/teichoic acid export membrane protein